MLEVLTGMALFLASAGWVWWQNRRVAVLWDLSYLLDSSWRFSLGQVPYRDIPFAHAPLTFLVHAGLIRLFGRVYWPHMAYAVMAGGLGTFVTWRLLRWVLRPLGPAGASMAALLSVPLIPLGLFGVYPHPIYDNDAILTVLVALFALIRSLDSPNNGISNTPCVFAGALCVLPAFFKQNIGVPFLGSVMIALALFSLKQRRANKSLRRELLVGLGACGGLLFALASLHLVAGLRNYLHWTVQFAAQRRLPGISVVLGTYKDPALVWGLPLAALGGWLLLVTSWGIRRWAKTMALLLITAPFLWTLLSLFRTSDADDRADRLLSLWPYVLAGSLLAATVALWRDAHLRSCVPWIVLATIHGTFLSQQVWGSTYAIWPLLMLLIAFLVTVFRPIAWPAVTVISAVLAVCGATYAASLERLGYAHRDGQIATSSLPALAGMRTPGPWLPSLDELVHFADAEIPATDGVLLIPGEDPFFFATGRTPHFPALLFDPATYPYNPGQTVELARKTGIEWLVLKRDTQLTAPPYEALPAITAALKHDFVPYRRLALYDIYKRR